MILYLIGSIISLIIMALLNIHYKWITKSNTSDLFYIMEMMIGIALCWPVVIMAVIVYVIAQLLYKLCIPKQ